MARKKKTYDLNALADAITRLLEREEKTFKLRNPRCTKCVQSWSGKMTGTYGFYGQLLDSTYTRVVDRPHDSSELRRVLKAYWLELQTLYDIIIDMNGSAVYARTGQYVEELGDID